ncbi:periplasmic heavy metal sensor [Gemmobacter sp.]|uniref:periplasmic heavy metal sensor n=1 Tax=Gemmobacter sp. TaxID=1898957 RepID=UPI002AFE2CC2|nr:periplasmic heavy metal sensor [Gemmobacter sp.]
MTDPVPHIPNPPRSRRLRWLLVASLTLNLLVVGVVAGVGLRFAGGDMPPPRSIGFGPWSGGLDRSDHKALREAFGATGRDFRADWQLEREDRAALLAALRADPFDPAALDSVTARMNARATERMDLGQRLIRDHILAMTPDQRRAFADRLEMSRRHGKDGGKGRDGDRGKDRPGD